MKKLIRNIITIGIFLIVSGCIATTYGKKPIKDPVEKDVYSFTLYRNQYASVYGEGEYMNKEAAEQINIIMKEYGYQRYEILNVDSKNMFTNKSVYRVKFFNQ